MSEAVEAELDEALGKACVHGGLWKIISWGGYILLNHHDSPIFNIMLVKYLNIVHVHLAQYNKQ